MNLNNYLIQTEREDVKNWINTVLKAQTKKENFIENIGEIEHIIDYFNSDESPKRVSKIGYDEAIRQSKLWVEKMNKKAQGIVETENDTKVIIDFGDGTKLVKLIGENAFKREGNIMSHCVGSYANRKDVDIYSLRDIKNNPHATIEVNKVNVNQIKGKGNGSIHPKYIKYIIEVLKYFKMNIRDSEMENLGYKIYDNEYLNIMEKVYGASKLKYITFNGKKYIYNMNYDKR